MGFPRQECWSGLPSPSPGDLPDQGQNLSLWCLLHWQVVSLPLSHQGNPIMLLPVPFPFSPSFLLSTGPSKLQFLAITICNFLLFLLINSRWKIYPHSSVWLQQPVSRELHVYSVHATSVNECLIFAGVRPCAWQLENCPGTLTSLIGTRLQLWFLSGYTEIASRMKGKTCR